ncbi:MAG: molybdopterin-dependent oxidoreductase, partial [Lewinella sp.]|nr:molybdopterin-dependent oxidoreductase [Lewinella sp.]
MNMPTEKNDKKHFSRRQFLTAAGGITFVVAAGAIGFRQLNRTEADTTDPSGHDLTAWVRLSHDGQLTFYNPAAEMGQGSMTALAVIFAEEMDVDWADVHIEMAPVLPKIYGLQWSGELGGPMLTVGSRTIRGYFKALRHAGAQARFALLRQAAQYWETDPSKLKTEAGSVINSSNGHHLSYGELASQIAEAG